MPPHDALAAANTLVKISINELKPISNLSLQKLLFFSNAWFLVEKKVSLINGYFEAWQFGPVHPEIYEIFKKYEDRPITSFGSRVAPISREVINVAPINEPTIQMFLESVFLHYAPLGPYGLSRLSHSQESPWDQVWNQVRGGSFGMRISEGETRTYFLEMLRRMTT